MNSALNRLGLFMLAGLGLALAGCTDHGPVGLFSKELFNKNVAPPHLDYNSASALTFTVSPGFADNSSGPFAMATVSIMNNGGCPTYGPVLAAFSCADPNLHFFPTNGVVEAYGANASGQEVPNNTNLVTVLRGYRQNGTNNVIDPNNSFEFWYAVPAYSSPLPLDHAVPITIAIQDAIGGSWTVDFGIDLRY